MLELEDQWIWDFWITQDHDRLWHCYFLKADKSLGDPNKRHFNVSQGHATSVDLVNWNHLGTTWKPSAQESFDDYTTWTGSVMFDNDQWHYFYTGTSKKDKGMLQRIGHASGNDLHNWKKVNDGLALDLDPTIYEEFRPEFWHDRALRDPWVMRHPVDTNSFLMAYTARVPRSQEANDCGAIGLAISQDLNNWKAIKPLFEGGFGQLEVPQIFKWKDKWYCTFCVAPEHWSINYKNNYQGHVAAGTHYLMADNFEGPWEIAPGPFFTSFSPSELYAGRFIINQDQLLFMAFYHDDPRGNFIGKVSDPFSVEVEKNGILKLVLE